MKCYDTILVHLKLLAAAYSKSAQMFIQEEHYLYLQTVSTMCHF
jgi:hypothetical protein